MDLDRFAIEVIEQRGGIAEPVPGKGIHVLLPEGLAARLGLSEDAWLDDGTRSEAAEVGSVALFHGSELVERLTREAVASGHVGVVHAQVPSPTVRSPEGALAKVLAPRNGVIRDVAASPVDAAYLVLSYHYQATGEERREGVIDVALDPTGTRLAPGLPATLWEERSPLVEGAVPDGFSLTPAVSSTASALVRAQTAQALEPVGRILEHRLARDVQRLHGYLHAMQKEVFRTGTKRALDENGAAKLLERLNQLPAELERRIADARARLTLRVTVRPIGALLVTMPALAITARVFRRKLERVCMVNVGGLHRSSDAFICEGCRSVEVTEPILCDEKVHLLCEQCLWTCPVCQATTCLACHRRCRRCGQKPDRGFIGTPEKLEGAGPDTVLGAESRRLTVVTTVSGKPRRPAETATEPARRSSETAMLEPSPMPAKASPMPAKASPMPAKASPMPAKASPMPAKASPMSAKPSPGPGKASPSAEPSTPAKPSPIPAKPGPTPGTPTPPPGKMPTAAIDPTRSTQQVADSPTKPTPATTASGAPMPTVLVRRARASSTSTTGDNRLANLLSTPTFEAKSAIRSISTPTSEATRPPRKDVVPTPEATRPVKTASARDTAPTSGGGVDHLPPTRLKPAATRGKKGADPVIAPQEQAVQALRQLRLQLDGLVGASNPRELVKRALAKLGRARTDEIAAETGIAPDTARQAIRELRELGVVRHEGHGRGVLYSLAPRGQVVD